MKRVKAVEQVMAGIQGSPLAAEPELTEAIRILAEAFVAAHTAQYAALDAGVAAILAEG